MSDPNFPSTDPRVQGIAAGSSGGTYGFMQVAISDKAAKDFSKAMTSIEEGGKAGTYAMVLQVFEKMMEFAGSGFIESISKFLEIWQNITTGEVGEAVAKFNEELLFTKKNMDDMAESARVVGEVALGVVDSMVAAKEAFEDFDEYIFQKWILDVRAAFNAIDGDFQKWILDSRASFNKFDDDVFQPWLVSLFEGIVQWFENIKASILSLGGGGGGGDDNPWYDPWGILG